MKNLKQQLHRVENTSKALKELPTTLEEVNKVFNKEVSAILKKKMLLINSQME